MHHWHGKDFDFNFLIRLLDRFVSKLIENVSKVYFKQGLRTKLLGIDISKIYNLLVVFGNYLLRLF